MTPPEHLVVVGCSWGGLEGLSRMLDHVPADLPAPIVVAQHRLHNASNLAGLLSRHTTWPVCEVEDKEPIGSRHVYLAPPGYHLLIDDDRFALSTEGPVRHSRPSIDVLFESAADSFTHRVVGVVLTGANADGAEGLVRIIRRGGLAVVQDPETAERRDMPEAALATGVEAHVARLEEIGPLLCELIAGRRRQDERSGT
ncbi:MAG: chemotaxis protein CheB [Actinomycetota bacterium]|nr:chemotaxis protein CheB [Actinomycetota bacterium]